jgi:hypothetical protein
MSDLPEASGDHPSTPPCFQCDNSEHVLRIELPEYRHIRHYRCLVCGHYWTTNLRGGRILTAEDDDSMLFV